MFNISARNQLNGTVKAVHPGKVNGLVVIDVDGQEIVADITMGSIKRLGIEEGKKVVAIIKASSVMVAAGADIAISARNQLNGTVKSVEEGAVNGIVEIELAGGQTVTADITMGSIKKLGLEAGKKAAAVIKATEVMVGVEA
ncbi:MAG: TOBE domain-containing protein [Coriobacteriales bacterium]|jgi:molybdate transport system regulatory protein